MTVSIPRDVARRIEAYAQTNRIPKSRVVTKALEKFLKSPSDESTEEETDELWEERIEEQIGEIQRNLSDLLSKMPDVKKDQSQLRVSDKKREILELFNDCIEASWDEEGFEIEGDEGFFAQLEERGLTGDVWTDDLLRACAKWLKVGYDGYLSKPTKKDLLAGASKAMKLNHDQKEVLASAFMGMSPKVEPEAKEEIGTEEKHEKEFTVDSVDFSLDEEEEE